MGGGNRDQLPMHRRMSGHDYRAECDYHITMISAVRSIPFSSLTGDASVKPGLPGSASVILSPLGEVIATCIGLSFSRQPLISIPEWVVMPDHLHMVVRVRGLLQKALGSYIGYFAASATSQARKLGLIQANTPIFERGFNDKILFPDRGLAKVLAYVRENPHRLLARRQFPEYFLRVNRIEVFGRPCALYGNLLLVRSPFMQQVVVHRADSASEREIHRALWLRAAGNGVVSVSPFISPDEKMIKNEIEDAGGSLIVVTNEKWTDRFKPAAHDFALCQPGRLLYVRPLDIDFAGDLSRRDCLAMNSFAQFLVAQSAVWK